MSLSRGCSRMEQALVRYALPDENFILVVEKESGMPDTYNGIFGESDMPDTQWHIRP